MDQDTFNSRFEDLTPGNRKVLTLFLQNFTDDEIAKRRDCTGDAVRKQFQTICKIFDLTNESNKGFPHRRDLIELFVEHRREMVSLELVRKLTPELLPKFQGSQSTKLVELENPEGPVPPTSDFYIERPPVEMDCYRKILEPGALIRIKAPGQMGKSSLTIRILNYAQQQNYRVASLDLQSTGADTFNSPESFLYWFCDRITRKLGIENQLAECWTGGSGANDKCTDYFETYLLPEINSPLVLCLDGVDRLFKYEPVAEDFFSLLRGWHEEAKKGLRRVWENLRLIVTHSREVYIPLNINHSPFNVGTPVELLPFTLKQVEDLIQRHDLRLSQREIELLMSLLGGHPYLIRVALFHISRSMTLSDFLRLAPTEEGIYNNHLRRHWSYVLENNELMTAMQQVVASSVPVNLRSGDAFKLSSAGLIKHQGNRVALLCELYRQYFSDRFGVM